MADHSRHERLLKQQVGSLRCRVCRRSFHQDQVRVAARHEHLWIVSVRCSLCRNQQVFWVALKDLVKEELLGDVTLEEQERFAAMPPVSGDDILDMHDFLSDFDGDFGTLFTGAP